MRRNKPYVPRRGILYALMLFLAFLSLLVLAIGGLYMYHRNRDFYSAFQSRLHPAFYLSAVGLLMFSSVLYTPFSYGISNYFILASAGKAKFSSLFFLFCHPIMLMKATAIAVVKKILIYLDRLMVLLAAALLEVFMVFAFLLLSGEDLFAIRQDPFELVADFMLRSPGLIALSVLLWSGVLFAMLMGYLKYILCKYVLICVPAVGVWQAIHVGREAIRGHRWQTLYFYLRYGACLILRIAPHSESQIQPFSIYASALAEAGWRNYCRKRSLRK